MLECVGSKEKNIMNTFTQNCRVRHFDPKGINVKLLLLHAWLPSNIIFYT